MIPISIEFIIALLVVVISLILIFLKLKERNRLALFKVLIHLAVEDMTQPFTATSLDKIQKHYNKIHETLEEAQEIAKTPAEKKKCEKLLKDLSEWRLQQIQIIYQKKLNEILKKYHQTPDINRKLTLLFEARNLVLEGILPNAPLKKIDNLILRLYVMKAHILADGQPEEKRYEIFEEYVTKILNSGIEDSELDESKAFREFIKEFEVLYRKYKKKRLKKE